jgi:hypothetical protein
MQVKHLTLGKCWIKDAFFSRNQEFGKKIASCGCENQFWRCMNWRKTHPAFGEIYFSLPAKKSRILDSENSEYKMHI